MKKTLFHYSKHRLLLSGETSETWAKVLICTSFHNWRITEISTIKKIDSLTFHDTPGVKTTSDPLTSGLHYCITANDSKWSTLLQHTQTQQQSFLLHLSALNHKSSGSRVICLSDLQLFVHLFKLFLLIRITLGELIDFNPEAFDLISHLKMIQPQVNITNTEHFCSSFALAGESGEFKSGLQSHFRSVFDFFYK